MVPNDDEPPRKRARPQTRLITLGRDESHSFDFVNPPLVRGSTVLHKSVADMRERVRRRNTGDDAMPVAYGIYGTPTHHALYDAMTQLEGGAHSWATPSGLTACTMSILAYVMAGDHVLVPDSVYWPTRRFCRDTLPRYGVETTFYDPRMGAEIETLFRRTTRAIVVESPGSHTFEMQDIPLLASIAHARDAYCVADNTWATPLYCQPLKLGADVVVHAATKYIGGHSDLLMGTLTTNERAWPRLRETMQHYGLTTSPDDCWIALRGLRSMGARLAQHRTNADKLIAWLQTQPEVDRVLYPALPEDPGHALWKRDMTGATGLFGVVLKPVVHEARFHDFVDGMQRFGRGYSWGGYESLLIPSFPERTATRLEFPGPLFRVHAGLEDADDLIEDLEAGFARLRR
ncbi:MAG TPA: cystathionine beta-lyase [Burkholderiaceae bacterium]|nr:cystathionine beta-lyase [Burkholderiaceae bacterium]